MGIKFLTKTFMFSFNFICKCNNLLMLLFNLYTWNTHLKGILWQVPETLARFFGLATTSNRVSVRILYVYTHSYTRSCNLWALCMHYEHYPWQNGHIFFLQTLMFSFDYGFSPLFALEINAITFTRSQDFTRTVSRAADTENPKAEANTQWKCKSVEGFHYLHAFTSNAENWDQKYHEINTNTT